MTDDQIDNLLLKVSTLAMAHDVFEYGLPVIDHDWAVKARALVREALGPAPAYCGHCAFPLAQCKCKQGKQPDVTKCPACGGPADNGYHRGDDVEPATAMICSKCWKQAEEQV